MSFLQHYKKSKFFTKKRNQILHTSLKSVPYEGRKDDKASQCPGREAAQHLTEKNLEKLKGTAHEPVTPENHHKINATNRDISFSFGLGELSPTVISTAPAAGKGFRHRYTPGVGGETRREGPQGSHAQPSKNSACRCREKGTKGPYVPTMKKGPWIQAWVLTAEHLKGHATPQGPASWQGTPETASTPRDSQPGGRRPYLSPPAQATYMAVTV